MTNTAALETVLMNDGDLLIPANSNALFSTDWDDEEPTRYDALAAMGVTEFSKEVL